ncbi:22109_t:CDS:2 [Rhizophagus irregularis]|nr:22109_t:CDS:2 [Rhizophagus irregularis]
MSYSQDSGEMNEINEYQQDEESQEIGETSSFFTRSRASSISDISGESASLSSITSKKRRYNGPGPGGSSKKSFIWKYFSEGANPIGPGKVMTCNLNNSEGQPCQRTYAAFGSTSNAIQHLASVHGIVEQGKIHIKAVKSGVIDQMIKNQNKNKWTESQQIVADRKLAKWILNSTSPLDTVNNIYLNEFLTYLNPHYNLPNDKNLKLLIYQAYGWTEESMKELLSSSAKRLIRFFMYPKQIERLKETQTSLNYQRVLGVIGDVSTRWNSLFLAWERLIYLNNAIDQLATDLSRNRDNNVKKDGRRLKSINLTEEEWTFMEELVDLLGLFEEATTFLSGSTYATLSLMHPTISTIKSIFEDDLITNAEGDETDDFSNTITILDNDDDEEDEQEFLEQPEDDDDYVLDPTTRTRVRINQAVNMEDIIEKVKEIILQALHKYWNIPSDIALKAAFLDPRFKDLTFARNKKDRIIRLIQDELNQVGNLLSEDNPNDDDQGINETEVTERRGESPVINVLIGDTGNHVSVRRTRLDPNLLRTMVFLKRNMKAMDIFPPDE